MRKQVLSVVLALLGLAAFAAETEVRIAKWKGDAKACFLLAFDDGCPSQLQNAMPVLNKYKVPGTFYIYPSGGHFSWQKDKWAKAAESEYVCLGNHTMGHKGVNAPEELEPQVKECAEVLKAMTPNEKWPRIVSFAVPGGVPWKVSKEEVKDVLDRCHHVERPSYHGPPWFCGNPAEAEKLIDTTIAKGDMEHIDFHGVGGDWLSGPTELLEAICKKLDANRKDIWPASAADCHKYATERDAASLAKVSVTKTKVVFELAVKDLDADLYDLPLTVVVPAPGWTSAKVTVGKAKTVTVPVVDGKALAEVRPGLVKVEKAK